MKSIVYRGGVVTFRIPFHWREEYSDFEGGMFYEDRLDSGTLRLTIVTVHDPKQTQPISATAVLQVVVNGIKKDGVVGFTQKRKDGNAVFKYEQGSSERGVRLTIFYWVVANPLPSGYARLATFSYTILAKNRNQPRVQNELAMLDTEIEAAAFAPNIGVISE